MRNHTAAARLAAGIVVLGTASCGKPITVDCGSGGRCQHVADIVVRSPERALALPDLRRATAPTETRVWSIHWVAGSGTLTRFTRSPSGPVVAERYEWWPRSAPRAKGATPCASTPATEGHVAACRTAGVSPPYAGNILHVLEARGLRRHPGGAIPTRPRTPPPCAERFCFEPEVLIVEIREGRHYRTYGYTVPVPADSSSSAIWMLSLQLSIPPFP